MNTQLAVLPPATTGADVFSQLFGSNSKQVELNGFPETGNYCFGVFGNGIFEKETVPHIGTFTTLKSDLKLPGLSSQQASFTFGEDFKLIPIGILFAMVKFYRKVMESIKSEVMTMVIYNKQKEDYELKVPVQQVAGASVKYDAIQFAPHEVYIASFHSHVNMAAFFSTVK